MKLTPTKEEFLAAAVQGIRMPVVLEIPLGGLTPTGLYRRIRKGNGFLLHSAKNGRYSYAATDCALIPDISTPEVDPITLLARSLTTCKVYPPSILEGFSGGVVGYLSYDVARHLERLPYLANDDLQLPDAQFFAVDRFYQIDHDEQILRIVDCHLVDTSSPNQQYEGILANLQRMRDAIFDDPEPVVNVQYFAGPVHANMSQVEFESIVVRAKEYIRAGDVFQVNLSVRFEQDFEGDIFALYETLAEVNPAPYASFMEFPGFSIVSASPELLIKASGKKLSTRPIAGTRRRGKDEAEDKAKAAELIENEKERAEHLMLVDLERNDLGRVAKYGTVKVKDFMGIEYYSHVMHIVSHISAQLADSKTVFDAIRACFPGGTITGTPKVRSMEIIEELEPVRRNIYTGSIGWIGFNGDTELNIAIRSIVVANGKAYTQAGAGIVADSDPAAEYKESRRKAEAQLHAIRLCAEVRGTEAAL